MLKPLQSARAFIFLFFKPHNKNSNSLTVNAYFKFRNSHFFILIPDTLI